MRTESNQPDDTEWQNWAHEHPDEAYQVQCDWVDYNVGDIAAAFSDNDPKAFASLRASFVEHCNNHLESVRP